MIWFATLYLIFSHVLDEEPVKWRHKDAASIDVVHSRPRTPRRKAEPLTTRDAGD